MAFVRSLNDSSVFCAMYLARVSVCVCVRGGVESLPESLPRLLGCREGLALGVVAEDARIDEAAEREPPAGVGAEQGECWEHRGVEVWWGSGGR